jgi:hypothetical protein
MPIRAGLLVTEFDNLSPASLGPTPTVVEPKADLLKQSDANYRCMLEACSAFDPEKSRRLAFLSQEPTNRQN